MTDYLEELLDNADALLEQIRQMEQSLSNLAVDRGKPLENDAGKLKSHSVSDNRKGVYNQKNQVNQAEKLVDKPGFEGGNSEKNKEMIVNLDGRIGDNLRAAEQVQEHLVNGEQPDARPVLAVQLEQLDRAVSAAAGTQQSRRETLRSTDRNSFALTGTQPERENMQMADVSSEGWSGEKLASARLFPGEEERWAEQADRVFRRDSRRYDGGFYLY